MIFVYLCKTLSDRKIACIASDNAGDISKCCTLSQKKCSAEVVLSTRYCSCPLLIQYGADFAVAEEEDE